MNRQALRALVAVGFVAMLTAACQPPPPPPPERIDLTLTLYVEQPLIEIGMDINWKKREFQIRTLPDYAFCDPRIVSNQLPVEPVNEPLAPGVPELEGVRVEGIIVGRGTVTFNVLNNQACWNQDLWANFGGHPYKAGWDIDVSARLDEGEPLTTFDEFFELFRTEYDIVK